MVSLQLAQNRLSTTNSQISSRLLLRIHDLSMINNQCVARGALAHGPAEFLGEGGVGVGEEELFWRRLVDYSNEIVAGWVVEG
jgi:hypothetical protein